MSAAASTGGQHADVVATVREAQALDREPLIVLAPLEAYLDQVGLGGGPPSVAPIGAGHSNVNYAIDRGGERFVLRRPPRGPLHRSTHDVLREARLLRALAALNVPVPDVLTVCEDPGVIGAPFYVTRFIDGRVLGDDGSPELVAEGDRAMIAHQVIDALVELHRVDVEAGGLASLGRRSGYLERQLRRFRELAQHNVKRSLPGLVTIADWLEEHLPRTLATTLVHGDYRLGNVMFGTASPPRLIAILDWEMATLGDPLADLGYLAGMWAEPGDPPDPMLDLSAITRLPGFPRRGELIARYARLSGRDVAELGWYQTLALWKAAIFLESSYGRYLAGTTHDDYFARLETGVPALASRAMDCAASAS